MWENGSGSSCRIKNDKHPEYGIVTEKSTYFLHDLVFRLKVLFSGSLLVPKVIVF
jgi:hypothetical protein